MLSALSAYMQRDLRRLADSHFEIVIVGGGVMGAFIAWDAALRGFSVAMIERNDFGSGTSANTMGILHGGLRYLKNLDIRRVRRSILERSTWLRIAPHLVGILPILVPAKTALDRALLKAAMSLADMIGTDRNRGLTSERYFPASRYASVDDCAAVFSSGSWKPPDGGVVFFDGQLRRPERAIIELVSAASQMGAAVANYLVVEQPIKRGDRLRGVTVRDIQRGDVFDVVGDIVINAAGPQVGAVAELLGATWRGVDLPMSLSFNLVVDRPHPDLGFTFTAHRNARTRRLFSIPWRNRTVVGTEHLPAEPTIGKPRARESQIKEFLDSVNTGWPGDPIMLDEILAVPAGFVPILPSRRSTTRLLPWHRIVNHSRLGLEGLITVITEKLTTARYVAERTVDMVCAKLGKAPRPSLTGETLLPGAQSYAEGLEAPGGANRDALPDPILRALTATYGAGYKRIVGYSTEMADWSAPVAPGSTVIKAQLTHGMREEMAMTVEDLLNRRTDLGNWGPAPSEAIRAAEDLLLLHSR